MNLETYRSISTNDSLVLANLGTLLVHIIMQQNKSIFIYFMCVYVLLVSKCAMCNPCARGSQKGASDAVELDLWMVMSCFVGIGNGTHVLYKKSK